MNLNDAWCNTCLFTRLSLLEKDSDRTAYTETRRSFAMSVQVKTTDCFRQAWKQLTPQMQRIVKNKIDLLEENSGHPSLNAHRLRQAQADIWVCYISNSM